MSPRSAAITACCVLAFSLLTACGQEATQVAAPSDSAPPATPSGNDADLARAQTAAQAFSSQLQQRLQGAVRTADLLQLFHIGRIVDLIQVDVIGAQVLQTGFDIRSHTGLVPGHTLGSDDEMLPDALQSFTQIAFADGVTTGGVDVVDAGVLQLVHQHFGAGSVDALDGNAAEAHAGNLQTGFA